MAIWLIMIGFLVYSKWTSSQPHNDQFQNLFNSIVKNNFEKSEMQFKILKQQVARQGQAFHAIKEELYARNGKRHQNLDSNENVAWTITKRETNDTYIAPSLNVRYGSSADVNKSKDKQPFIFPEVKTDNAIDATKNLLNSQRMYQTEIDRLFREICKKNKNHPQIDLLERSIDGFIEMAYELIHNNTKIIDEQVKNGSASDYFKKKPLSFKASRLLNECWKYVDDFVDNYGPEFNFDLKPEVDEMRKSVDFAMREIESYQKYLEIVYVETGIYRDDETNLDYFKYKKLDEEAKDDDYSM